jgi:hypothetical protein
MIDNKGGERDPCDELRGNIQHIFLRKQSVTYSTFDCFSSYDCYGWQFTKRQLQWIGKVAWMDHSCPGPCQIVEECDPLEGIASTWMHIPQGNAPLWTQLTDDQLQHSFHRHEHSSSSKMHPLQERYLKPSALRQAAKKYKNI